MFPCVKTILTDFHAGLLQYPLPRDGFSNIHANDRGHLLPNVPRRRESPWGTFVGTWDMPTKIPGQFYLLFHTGVLYCCLGTKS